MNVLITGASGLIGSHLIDQLCCSDNLVICQSRKDMSHLTEKEGVIWIKHDLLNDTWDCLDNYKLDVVFHLAAQTSAYNAEKDPKSDLEINVKATIGLLDYFKLKSSPPPFFIFASTATIAGYEAALPISEKSPACPSTFYDISKYTAERYLLQYIEQGFASGCCLRLANVYGAKNKNQKEDRGILDRVHWLASKGKEVQVYGHGNYLRDYIHVLDVVSAFIAAETHRTKTNGQCFYIGTGSSVYLKQAFLLVAKIATGRFVSEQELNYVPWPDGALKIEMRNVVIDPSLFVGLTGWSPNFSLEEGLKAAYQKGQ